MPAEAKKVDYTVQAPGTIDAFERVQVTARVAGVVDRVAFTEGQEVKKGDMLVVIDSERYQLAVNSAKAALEKAQAAQKDSRRPWSGAARARASSIPASSPARSSRPTRRRALTAKADTAVAAEALKVARLNLRDSFVRAPIEGVDPDAHRRDRPVRERGLS